MILNWDAVICDWGGEVKIVGKVIVELFVWGKKKKNLIIKILFIEPHRSFLSLINRLQFDLKSADPSSVTITNFRWTLV